MANLPSNNYFLHPFATLGDVTMSGIPANAGGNGGTVSYEYGWTTPYAVPVSGSGFPVPRISMNQLMLDITTAIQTLQKQGFPNYIASADGGPTQYPAGAWVNYMGAIYVAQVATGSVPGADTTWQVQGIPPGAIVDYSGFGVPIGYLPCTDGLTPYLRSDYPNLINAITMPQTCTTNMSTTLTVIDNSQMFVGMFIEGADIPGMTTLTVVDYGTPTTVTMSNAATGSNTEQITFFKYGNGDGSTTFNTPALGQYTKIGSGGPGIIDIIGNVTGQKGGEPAHLQTKDELFNHTHTAGGNFLVQVSGAYPLPTGSGAFGPNANSGNVTGEGDQVAFNIIQQSAVVTFCIKT